MLKEPLIAIEGATNVVFDGIAIENSRGMGVYIERGASNRVQNATLRNLGIVAICVGKGVSPDPLYRHAFTGTPISRALGSWHEHIYNNSAFDREGGQGQGIVNCDIYNIGAGAISLAGGDRMTLIPAGNFVENCHIHHFNRWDRSYKGAINIEGVGNRISHCLIHDAPALAIYLHGNDHLIEYNEIHHAVLESQDMGAFYMGRDPSERGNVIRYNFWHHIGSEHVSYGMHFDDGCGDDSTLYGNVFWHAGSSGTSLIIGNKVTVKNNIFVDGGELYNYYPVSGYPRKRGTFQTRLNAIHYDQSPYKDRYPDMVQFFEDFPQRQLVLEDNLIINFKEIDEGAPRRGMDVRFRNNRVLAEAPSLFVDAEAGDFNIKSGVDIGIKGFKPIPFDEIGLQTNTYRRSLPVDPPTFATASRCFVDSLEVALKLPRRSAGAVYTTDGTTPTLDSTRYHESITLNKDSVLFSNVAQEIEPLLMPMPIHALADDATARNIHGGKERRHPVTDAKEDPFRILNLDAGCE